MENNDEENNMVPENEDYTEIKSNTSAESGETKLKTSLNLNPEIRKSALESNKGSSTSSPKIRRQSKTSITSFENLRKEVSELRQSTESNPKPFSSKSSNDGGEKSRKTSHENPQIIEHLTENKNDSESYDDKNAVASQNEIGENPKSKSGSSTSSPKIRGHSKISITTLESIKKEVPILSQSITSAKPFSSNDEAENLGKTSIENQSMIENAPENKKGSKSYVGRTLSQVSQNEIGENPTLEKSKKNKKSSPRNEILKTIAEDEEVTDVDREHLEMDKLNLKPVEDGKKSISYKEVANKKHNVRNSKTTKKEKGVQFPITAGSRSQDASNRKFSIFDGKRIRFSIKDAKRDSHSYSLLYSQFSSSDPNHFQNKGHHQLGPCYKFSTKYVQQILLECIEKMDWQMITYSSKAASQLTLMLASEALKAVREEHYDRCRLCVEVTIGENLMQGVHADSQCLWDEKLDCFATSFVIKPTFFVFIVCYGIYKE